jgi:Cell division protein FtsI/penicillin-binding protein 2
MEQPNKKLENKGVMSRYGLIVTFLILFSVMIVFSAGKVIFSDEGKKWREVGEKETVIKDRVILPTRGNIYTCDGKLLATSEPLYSIYMDFWADGMQKDTLEKYVGPLSKALAKKFPSRSANQYRNLILSGWKQREKEERQIEDYRSRGIDKKVTLRSRYIRIIKEDISYVDLKEIRTFPFLIFVQIRADL